MQDFTEPSTTTLRKVFSTCISFAKYVEWKEPDVAAAEQRVYTVLEENLQNQERIEVLRREYDMACNDQEDKDLVRYSVCSTTGQPISHVLRDDKSSHSCLHSVAHSQPNSFWILSVLCMLQQLESLSAQIAEEEARLEHLQEEADIKCGEEAAAKKAAHSAQTSLMVLEEKYRDAQAALQDLKSQLCEVRRLCVTATS